MYIYIEERERVQYNTVTNRTMSSAWSLQQHYVEGGWSEGDLRLGQSLIKQMIKQRMQKGKGW